MPESERIKRYREAVSLMFYRHGLRCSSHPLAYITIVIIAFLFICQPLANFPFFDDEPLRHTTSLSQLHNAPTIDNNQEFNQSPRWYFGKPLCYIHQIIVRSALSDPNVKQSPIKQALSSVFDVLHVIDAFRFTIQDQITSLSDVCLRVSEIPTPSDNNNNNKNNQNNNNDWITLMPEYNCLLLSPARIWKQDKFLYKQDSNILRSIFPPKHDINADLIRDLLFGISGSTYNNLFKFNGTNENRGGHEDLVDYVEFAITIAYKEFNPVFVKSLQDYIKSHFVSTLNHQYLHNIINDVDNTNDNNNNVYVNKNNNNNILNSDNNVEKNNNIENNPNNNNLNDYKNNFTDNDDEVITHLHFPHHNFILEYTPLLFVYLVLCLYLYFSVRKIEMVKSKWGLALSAVTTVVASLFLSLSLCLRLGLTPSLKSGEIFPYLVVIIGLENVLVVTRSVVSTPPHLHVNIRIALGLQKEGWYIFKNLLTELLILAAGFLTFVPAIQEFCLFAILGLGSDFFFQMFFFTTVLSVDIRRMELSDMESDTYSSKSDKSASHDSPTYYQLPQENHDSMDLDHLSYYNRLKHHRNNKKPLQTHLIKSLKYDMINSRRLRFMHAWASYRVLQKTFMVFIISWFALVIYKATILEDDVVTTSSSSLSSSSSSPFSPFSSSSSSSFFTEDDFTLSTNFPANHWKNLFDLYNISLVSRYVSFLPATLVSIGVQPHHGNQPINQSEASIIKTRSSIINKLARYPQSSTELVLTCLLLIFSLFILIFILFLLYKCMCSRNYATWRSNMFSRNTCVRQHHHYYHQVREATPLRLCGHEQEVECVSVDGLLVASSCLAGEIRVWDVETAECHVLIHPQRRNQFKPEVISPSSSSSSSSSVSSSSSSSVPIQTSSDIGSIEQQVKQITKQLNSICDKINEDRCTVSSNDGVDSVNAHTTITDQSNEEGQAEAATSFDMAPLTTKTSAPSLENLCDRSKSMDSGLVSSGSSPGPPTNHSRALKQLQPMLEEQQRLVKVMKKTLKRKKKSDAKNEDVQSPCCLGSAIWSLALKHNIVVAGCGSGDVEFWDVQTNTLLSCDQHSKHGVTNIIIVKQMLVLSRFDGSIAFYYFHIHHTQTGIKQQHTQVYQLLSTNRAHQASITCLSSDQLQFAISAAQDNLIKVFRLVDQACVYTLIGHTSPITCLHVNKMQRVLLSGSDDLSIRVWSLHSGGCLHKLTSHRGSIVGIATANDDASTTGNDEDIEDYIYDTNYNLLVSNLNANVDNNNMLPFQQSHEQHSTTFYDHKLPYPSTKHYDKLNINHCFNNHANYRIFSVALDNRLCVWDAYKGDLLHCIQMETGGCNAVAVLSTRLLITAGVGKLEVWDSVNGENLRTIPLHPSDQPPSSVFVRHLATIDNRCSVVCDYGNELRVLKFDFVLEKRD